jgi:osmoprotectant transport system permease protein
VIDVYSTDAKIERYKLLVLEDDRSFFPAYDAVLFYRLDVPEKIRSDLGGRCSASKAGSRS